MKRLTGVLTAAFLLAAIAAGCSKEENGNMEENIEEQALTKEQIVGVWRSGDYWVSFSEDGYNSAYFPIDGEERIDEGMFAIDGDTITVKNSFYPGSTRYVINSISDTSINLTAIYDFSNKPFNPDEKKDARTTLTLMRTGEEPSRRINGLEGKTFTTAGTYISEDGTTYDCMHINTVHSSEKYQYIEYKFDSHGNTPEGYELRTMYKYYIYLQPVIYTVTLVAFDTSRHEDYVRGLKVDRGVIAENADGTLSYTPDR